MTEASRSVRDAYDLITRGDIVTSRDLLDMLAGVGDTDRFDLLSVSAYWHMKQHQWEPAIGLLKTAGTIRPLDYSAHYNQGFCHHKLGQFEPAAACYERCLALNPNCTKALVRLAHVCLLTEHFALGLALYGYAAALAPKDAEVRCGYGTGLSLFGNDASAENEYRRALEIDPAFTEAEMGLGFTLLRGGRWTEGWQRRQAVLRHPPFGAPWDYVPPRIWCGQPEGLRGKRVLLRSEQGYGDTIQFARYIPLVQQLAAVVHVETQESLVRLLAAAEAHVGSAADAAGYDIVTTLMSLPAVFATTLETRPPPAEYHVAPRRLGARLGLCWHGGARAHDPMAHADDLRRSISREMIAPLTDVVPWISLQQEDLTQWGCNDWYDTACVVAGLDLVITVDTAVAHLAASLGVPTWLLARANGCWRWLNAGTSTVWYPAMTIYRQPALGAWQPVITQVTADLALWAAGVDTAGGASM